MRTFSVVALLGLTLFSATLAVSALARSTADRYFFVPGDTRKSIVLHPDGTYTASCTELNGAGFYNTSGGRIAFHIQNQGDVNAVYDGKVIKFPTPSGYDILSFRPIRPIPTAYTNTWTSAAKERIYLADTKYWMYNADRTCRKSGYCLTVYPSAYDLAHGHSGPMIEFVGLGFGSIDLKRSSSGTPDHYQMALILYGDGNTYWFNKPYTKPRAARLHSAKRPVHKQRPAKIDTFGANGVGDDAGDEANSEEQPAVRRHR